MVLQASATSRDAEDWFSFVCRVLCLKGIRTKGSHEVVPEKKRFPSLCFVKSWSPEIYSMWSAAYPRTSQKIPSRTYLSFLKELDFPLLRLAYSIPILLLVSVHHLRIFRNPYFYDLDLRIIGFTKINRRLVQSLLAFASGQGDQEMPRAIRKIRWAIGNTRWTLKLLNKHNGRYYRFESSRRIGVSAYDCLVFQEGVFIEEGIMTKGSRGVVLGRSVFLHCVVAQIFWLDMKDVVSCIAEDIAGEGLDRGTFVLTLGSC
ncbi:hypothetical protein DY000_02031398 [Brassica cretica]|uniref:Uncharacterized protein n=1 Tax=Brassica cretica TaxID=69181 RepID=A0ABQ7DW72_BRACR|nr:hypothetical protein DY000_02031398 [Brassica cretica]